jgi:hypothetical protein
MLKVQLICRNSPWQLLANLHSYLEYGIHILALSCKINETTEIIHVYQQSRTI